MKDYTELQKIPIERTWKKFDIVTEISSEIFKNVLKNSNILLEFLNKIT